MVEANNRKNVISYAFFILMKTETIVKRLYDPDTKDKYGVGDTELLSFVVFIPNASPPEVGDEEDLLLCKTVSLARV